MNLKNKNILVTGGASFIGSHLVEGLLKRGAKVSVIDDLSSGKIENIAPYIDDKSVKFTKGDLFETAVAKEAVIGKDVVFHLAAVHGGRGFVDLRQCECTRNFAIDSNVLNASAELGVEKIVYASSGCVYPNYMQSDVNEELLLTEDDVNGRYDHNAFDADNVYGWAKLMMEINIRKFCKAGRIKGASPRYFTVYGDRGVENHAVIAMIARTFIQQNPFEIWGTGEQIRNWTHVEDIVEGTIRSAEEIDDGTAVNLGTTERTKVIEAARMITGYANKSFESHRDYAPEFKFLTDKPTGPYNRVADNSLAKKLLGDDVIQVPFAEGAKRTLNWYFANKDPKEVAKDFDAKLIAREADKKDKAYK